MMASPDAVMLPTSKSLGPSPDTAELVERNKRLHRVFLEQSATIRDRHAAQTAAEAQALRRKYEQPVFGEMPTWSLFEMLAHCVDASDDRLYCSSQEMHALQIIEAMEIDGVLNDEFALAAMVHDLGKIALLKGESQENLMYMNALLAAGPEGGGLDLCTLQWSSDDLTWSRLGNYLPQPIGWLVRYHGISVQECLPYMSERDCELAERYLKLFQRYDLCSKSPFFRPRHRLEDFRPLIDKYLPPRIVF